jgi:hypothetical protein
MVMKMKPLSKLASIAILLVGINGNACFAETQGPPNIVALPPLRFKCLDLLELEKIKADPKSGAITTNDMQLAGDYQGVVGWLRGFFTAFNHLNSDGDVAKGTNPPQMMTWIFRYCRAHPSENLYGAALEFIKAMGSTKN